MVNIASEDLKSTDWAMFEELFLGFSSAAAGDMRREENRRQFCLDLGFDSSHLVRTDQIHSNRILAISSLNALDHWSAGGGADGLVTDQRGLYLSILVADCVPVFLFDPKTNTIGIVHSGWRGLSSGIVQNAVKIMRDNFAVEPSGIKAYLGPSIGPCCFEVQKQVYDLFSKIAKSAVSMRDQKYYVDLGEAGINILLQQGLSSDNIYHSSRCTSSESGMLFSHRRDQHRAGRMLAIIGLKPELY